MLSVNMNMENVRYVQVPGQPHSSSCPPNLYRTVFTHWRQFWSNEYSSYGSHQALDCMDFYRQSLYCAVMDGDSVIATLGLSFFDLRYDFSHFSYFGIMHGSETMERLKSEGLNRIVGAQFFLVNPDYSPRRVGINWGAVAIGLGLKEQQGFDGSLCVARTGVAACSLAMKLGYTPVSEVHLVHNVPVVSLFCYQPQPYRRPLENELIHRLWQERANFSNHLRSTNENHSDLRPAGQSVVGEGRELSV